MHICLFGAAFDPPHLGHLEIARYLLNQKISDEVWFVPVKEHPFGKQVIPSDHRVKMLELMLETGMRIEEYELEHPGKSFSYDTLQALSKKHTQHQFSWVLGSDNLEKFHLWAQYESLLKEFPVYVYPRQGFDFVPFYPHMIALKEAPLVVFSSTEIREKIKKAESISGLVDERVERYIKAHKLYGFNS